MTGMDWIDLAQDKDRWRSPVNAVMKLQVPLNEWYVFTSWEPVSFSRRALLHGVRTLMVERMHPAFFLLLTPFDNNHSHSTGTTRSSFDIRMGTGFILPWHARLMRVAECSEQLRTVLLNQCGFAINKSSRRDSKPDVLLQRRPTLQALCLLRL